VQCSEQQLFIASPDLAREDAIEPRHQCHLVSFAGGQSIDSVRIFGNGVEDQPASNPGVIWV
jgi:hypothetical protein